MDKYRLFLRTLLVLWLFWFSYAILKEYRTTLRQNRFEIGYLGSDQLKIPFILDRNSGQVWKWFQGDNEMGFSQVNFFPSPVTNELAKCKADLASYKELQQVERAHSDFNDYREDVKKILETSKEPLTIEEAYKRAKENKLKSEK